jgi:LCP family protein required for cell wall assembly
MEGTTRPSGSPFLAATASAAVPGWGQIRVGKRRIGWALLSGTLVATATFVTVGLAEGTLGIASWLLDPDFLLALVILNLVVALVRGWATTHAWRAAGGRWAGVGLLVLLTFVGLPHAALGYYGLKSRSTINAVFPSGPQPTPPVTMATIPSTTTLPTTTTTHVGWGSLLPPVTASTTTTAPTTTTTLPLGLPRITMLLLGGDAGPGRSGLRTDTIIVASVDTVTGEAVLFGLPRDMTGFTFSDGTPFPGLGKGLLNEVYQWGNRHPEAFGGIDPGASAVKDVAAHLLGIPIDYFVLVDMTGFAEIVDVMGGVTVSVGQDVIAPVYNRENGTHVMTTIPAGSQLLDGDLALAYARSRTGSNDYSRMARQRCVLTALAEQVDPLALLPNLGGILDTVKENVTTDISPEQIPALLNLAPLLSSERVLVIGFARGYRLGTTAEGSLRPNVDLIRAAVQQALTNPGVIDPDLGMKPAAEACG